MNPSPLAHNPSPMGEYRRYLGRKILLLAALALVLVGAVLASILAGSSGLTLGQVLAALVGRGTTQTSTIVWNVRMPRIAAAVVVGCGLAVAGCVMQSVLHNPLASASTLGVSQGASFGATVAIVCLGAGAQQGSSTSGTITIYNPTLVTFCAFLGGMVTVCVILALSRVRMSTPATMILAGVALSSMFTGGATLVQYFADDVVLASVVYWTFGDLGRAGWNETGLIFLVLLVAFAYFLLHSWSYNALQSGPQTAKSLGVPVERLTLVTMTLAALLSAAAVSFVGIINFVGLIAPHMVRRLVGSDHRFLLPASALAGASVLLLSDLLARVAASPMVLPIGAVTSFLGAPLFLYLIYKGAK